MLSAVRLLRLVHRVDRTAPAVGSCGQRHPAERLHHRRCDVNRGRSSYSYAMGALFTRLVPLCLIAAIPVLLAAQDTAPRETVLNHVSVIDMTGGAVQPDMAVLIRGDRIAAIERATGFNRPGARVIDLTGKFLLPGLVDMHHHLERGESMPGPPIPGQAAEQDVRGNLKEMLAWGFTTVFSTSHLNVDLQEFAELRRASVTDSALPRYFGVGRAISVAGGHASQPRFASYLPGSADEARANVREMQAAGVDEIKLIYADQAHTGRPPVPMMQPEVMRAIIDEAHRVGLKAYVHAPGMRQAKEVLRAGADGLVHSVTDAPLDDEFIALMKKNRATYTTTLSLYTAFSDVAGVMAVPSILAAELTINNRRAVRIGVGWGSAKTVQTGGRFSGRSTTIRTPRSA